MASKELTIFRIHMKDALVAAQKGEGELAILYQEVANDVTAKVRAQGDNISPVQLEGEINEAFEKVAFKRVKIIKTSIENAAKLGPKASKKTMRAVYGEEVAKAQVRSSKKALNEAAERIAGRTAVDGKSVSRRLRAVDKQISGEIAREVEQGVRQKKGILGAARQIEKLDPREVKLPAYIQRVRDAAKSGNVDALKKVTERYTNYVEGLGEIQQDMTKAASKYSLRSATKRFMTDIEKAGTDGVDKIVARYVKDKAAWRANVIARHETVEAFRRSYIEQSKNKPGVIGMQWRLSPTRHPVADECDVYANQNAYKLGPGVYPVDKVPSDPHPMCLCSVTVVLDKHHFQRQQADNDNAVPPLPHDVKSPDALGWLKANDAAAAKILGPTRHALLKQGVNVLGPDGKPLLVRDLLSGQKQMMAVGAPPISSPVAPKKPPKPAPVPKKKATPAPKPVAVERPKPPSAPPPPPPPPAPKPLDLTSAQKAARTRALKKAATEAPKPAHLPLQPPVPAPSGIKPVTVPKNGNRFPGAAEEATQFGALVTEAHAQEKMTPALARYVTELQDKVAEKFNIPVRKRVASVAKLDQNQEDFAEATFNNRTHKIALRLAAHKRLPPLQAVVHEIIHSFGGSVRADGQSIYLGKIEALEEAVTEELAQAYGGGSRLVINAPKPVNHRDPDAAKKFKARREDELGVWYQGGAYLKWRNKLYDAVTAASGFSGDADALQHRVLTAMARWKQNTHESLDEAMDAFIEHLEPNDKERVFLKEVFHDEAWWGKAQ